MLTVLEEKLAEAHALAIVTTTVTAKVRERVTDEELVTELYAMDTAAEETRARCLDIERGFGDELAEEILAHVNTSSENASDLVGAWFKADTGPLAAWTFLAMGKAAEVAIWRAVVELARRSPDADGVADLAAWALPIQERHLQVALEGATRLAARCDPGEPRWG
jgi:hypothetical protein